jgi:glycine cleavage system H lipoate-binding protein
LIETEINQAAIRLTDAKKILDAIRKDPYAIGFCRITDILANQGKEFATGIALLPIDKNGNGKMDYMEDIYNNPSEFMRGVWIGKYPKALSSEIFAVAPSQPTGAIEVAFLNWVLTGGQEMLTAEGLCSLVNNEKQSQLDKINITRIEPVTAQNGYTVILWIVLILVGLVAISFFIDRVFASYHGGSSQRATTTSTPGHFDDTTVSLPGGIFFDKTHTWAYMEPNGQVKVGLDDFILHATGPVTRIDMRQPGDRIQKGDPLCTIVHKGKQLRMYSPVSGIIKGQNSRLAGDSTILNRSPYSDGWIYEIEPANWLREMGFLTMADKYREWLKVEYTRLRDFIASCLQVHSPGLATVALQDGGSLTDHVLADLEPEVWEDFQTNFIDTKR